MRRVLASLAIAAACLTVPAVAAPALPEGGAGPVPSPAPVPEPASWRRVATSDGTIAVTIPCTAAESTERGLGATKMVSCTHGSLEYLVQMGDVPAQSGFKSYADLLASAHKDATAGTIGETTMAGHPAFTATRPADAAVTRALVVDLGPDRLVMLVAFQHDDQAKLDTAMRAAADADAERFIASLELKGK